MKCVKPTLPNWSCGLYYLAPVNEFSIIAIIAAEKFDNPNLLENKLNEI